VIAKADRHGMLGADAREDRQNRLIQPAEAAALSTAIASGLRESAFYSAGAGRTQRL